MYHSAWEVGELTDLVRARARLAEAGALVGQSDHGVSLSLYAKDPDGLEFEVFWTVPGGQPVPTRARPGARAGPPGHRDARRCEVLINRVSRAALPLIGLACVTSCLMSLLLGAVPLLSGIASAAPAVLTERPSFGDIPLSFEANQGQAGGSTQFLARGRGYSLSLNRDGVMIALGQHRGPRATTEPEAIRPAERTLLRMRLAGANPAPSAAGLEELPGKVNYFVGRDPKTWRTNIPTYGKVRYDAVYQGIDLVSGDGRQLKYAASWSREPTRRANAIAWRREPTRSRSTPRGRSRAAHSRRRAAAAQAFSIYQDRWRLSSGNVPGRLRDGGAGHGWLSGRRGASEQHHAWWIRSGDGLPHVSSAASERTMAAGSSRMPPESIWRG